MKNQKIPKKKWIKPQVQLLNINSQTENGMGMGIEMIINMGSLMFTTPGS